MGTFELSAIIDHIGQTQFSGHWKMHKKLTTWTTCNDDMILNNIPESEVKTINNTIFLYSLKGEMEDKQDLERSATDFIDFPPDKNQTTTVTDSSNPTTTVENTQEDVIKRKKKTKRGQYTLVEEGLSIDPCLGNIFGIPDDDLFHAINLFRGFDKKWPYGDFHPLWDYKKGSKFCLFCVIRSSVSRLNNINPAKKGKDLKPMDICSVLSMIRSVLKELFSTQKFFLYFLREIFSEKTQTVTLQQAICGQMGNVLREALESYGDLSSWSDMQVLAFELPDQCSVEIEYFASLGGVQYRYICHVDYQDKKIRSHFIHNDTVYSSRGDKVLTLSDSYSNETRLVVIAKENSCNNMNDVVYDAKALKTFSDRSRPYLSPAKAEMRKLYEQKRNELEERKVSKRLSDQKRSESEERKVSKRMRRRRENGRRQIFPIFVTLLDCDKNRFCGSI